MNNCFKIFKIQNNFCKIIKLKHCEASVKKALESVEGVVSANVSHEKGTAVVTIANDVADDILKKAVEDKDYKVTGIS